jgi:hypothetical protein
MAKARRAARPHSAVRWWSWCVQAARRMPEGLAREFDPTAQSSNKPQLGGAVGA